ncbi:hypothetical protein [Asanoa siamensis]|uniref:Uncharacterized protein n=1 Tax=Asanoa siamensis TaxID=926357 RepID=A0ABQ4CY45_9ACTN|nr:hypothetical protein [Asanoa siamensis]GIF76191.1 hypothetical protein Asi02nite_57090 [Asanoa siamensis]
MSDSTLIIPSAAVAAIASETGALGRLRVETGGFLLTPVGDPTITVVAFTGTTGIIRHRKMLQISARALGRLFDYADGHDLHAPAQFHSHETTAFLSRTDATHGLRVDGFTSVVIPRFASPPGDPAAWGWWTFRDTAWETITPARPSTGNAHLIRFDEDGIHAY